MSSHHATPHAIPHGVDREAIVRVVDPVLRAHGAELVDLELKPDRGGWVLRVFVEKAGSAADRLSTRDAAVDLELCADVSRDLSPALDVVDLIPHAYHLEVGSPGVERPLRGAQDFVRFQGQKAKLRLREPVGGQRVIIGVIEGATEEKVCLSDGSRTQDVPLAIVERAHLVFELIAQPKKGHGPAGGKSSKHPGSAGREHKQRKH